MNKAKALLTAGLAAGVIGLAWINNGVNAEDTVKDTTQDNVEKTLKASDEKNISREDAQKLADIQARKQYVKDRIALHADDTKFLYDFTEYYGSDVVEDKMNNILETIASNPEKYGIFDVEWVFHINEGKAEELAKETFKEAISAWHRTLILIPGVIGWFLGGFFLWRGQRKL